jgi:hypothetical protein
MNKSFRVFLQRDIGPSGSLSLAARVHSARVDTSKGCQSAAVGGGGQPGPGWPVPRRWHAGASAEAASGIMSDATKTGQRGSRAVPRELAMALPVRMLALKIANGSCGRVP